MVIIASLAAAKLAALPSDFSDDGSEDDEDVGPRGRFQTRELELAEEAMELSDNEHPGVVARETTSPEYVLQPGERSLRPSRKLAELTIKWNVRRNRFGNLCARRAERTAAEQARKEMRNHPAVVAQLEDWWAMVLYNYYTFPRRFEYKPDVEVGEVPSNLNVNRTILNRRSSASKTLAHTPSPVCSPFVVAPPLDIHRLDWISSST